MGLLSDGRKLVALARRALTNRSARREVEREIGSAAPLVPHHFQVAVYFADGEVNMYQMRQWYRPLAELAQTWPVVVLARSAAGGRALVNDRALPVAFVPSIRRLEDFVARQDIRVVLYVNQNTRNFQMFRYGHRWHVFINHGESDKMYMTTNQYKAYDYAFIAGRAARERLSRVLWEYDLDNRAIEIGRPQADYYSGALPYTPDQRTVVLYAPTWEGDRPSAHYGSLRTHGELLVAELLGTGRHRVIYRPHPRSGVVDPEYGAAHRRIVAAIAAANADEPEAQHIYDDGAELGWQLSAADIAVVDISAMVYDRLAAGRPLLVTRPVDSRASVDTAGYLGACEWLEADSPTGYLVELERVAADPEVAERLGYWVEHYFGDVRPGAPTALFRAAIGRLMDEWDIWHARTVEAGDPEELDEAELDEAELDD